MADAGARYDRVPRLASPSRPPRTPHPAPRTPHLLRSKLLSSIYEPTPLSSCALLVVRRQRLRRPDLRDRLVSAPPADHRIVVHLARHPARHLHGRHVSGQPDAVADDLGAPASVARLCGARARHRRARPADPGRDAAGRRHLHRVGRRGHVRHRVPRGDRRHLPAAADGADGRDAAGDLALGQGDPRRHLVAGLLLRRQYRRRRRRLRPRRLLSAARLRRRHGDLRRGGVQRRGGADRLPARRTDDL